jgi:uncharacterized membrane protein
MANKLIHPYTLLILITILLILALAITSNAMIFIFLWYISVFILSLWIGMGGYKMELNKKQLDKNTHIHGFEMMIFYLSAKYFEFINWHILSIYIFANIGLAFAYILRNLSYKRRVFQDAN